LICQFTTEGVILVAASTALGLIGAHWAIQLLRRLIPEDLLAFMPYLHGIGLNHRVGLFAACIAFLASVVVCLPPLLRGAQPDLGNALAEGSRGSAGTTWSRLGSKLVVTELATAMVLLVGAGLLGRSFYNLLQMNLGFELNHLATLEIAAQPGAYRQPERSIALAREIISRVSSLPGVQSVGICSQLPVSFNGNTDWIRFVGKPYHGEHNDVNQRDVSARYFQTIKAKLLQGRYFREDEDGSKPRVIVINRALANMYFEGENPVGKLVGNGDLAPSSIREIVGVVDDIREGPLDEPMLPTEYIPFNQDPDYNFALVARTSQDETSVLPAIAAAIHQIDRGIVTVNQASMRELIHDAPSTYLRRSSAWLAGSFAVSALMLGIVGLYGVIAYSVSQRTREIGVRIALGAQPASVYGLILKQAGRLAALGIGVGLICSIAAATLMRNLLFGTPAWDAATLTAVAVLLGTAALLASDLPARRAASVSPIDALRSE
jgi:predicted permease